MSTLRLPRLGLRREVLFLLPLAMLALVLLSVVTFFSYRNGIRTVTESRRAEAAELAGEAARRLAAAPSTAPVVLRAVALQARRAALVDADGEPRATVGSFELSDLLAPLEGSRPSAPVGRGPGPTIPDAVAGFAPLQRGNRLFYVRIDLPADELAGQVRGLRLLGWVALPVNFLVVGLVFLFLRYLLTPFDTLMAQARRVEGAPGPGREEDEVGFLLDTFERAVDALAQRDRGGEEEIAALQRALAPSLECGVLLLDREARVLALNSMGRELLAVAEPEVGTPVGEALRGHLQLLDILEGAVARTEGAQRREARILSGDRHRTLGLTVHALRRDDGGVRGYLILFVDLTEARRQAEEERLAEGLAQLGELAAGVAHELRNSLATLRGYLTLVERGPDGESLTDYLNEIRRESDHLVRVVEDFLTFARPESARVEEVDLNALLQRAAADPALEAGRVAVDAGDGRRVAVRGDALLLERALKNLLRNAVQAAAETGGGVRCSLARGQDGVEIVVEDRGPGLPDEIRRKLFQPFVTTRPDGVGLGLSLAHRILTLHGGTLRIEDRQSGGTRAVLGFPPGAIVTDGDNPR